MLIVRGRAAEASVTAFIDIMPGMLTSKTRADDANVGELITITTSPGATLIVCPEATIVPEAIDTATAPGASTSASADATRAAAFIEMLCGAPASATVNACGEATIVAAFMPTDVAPGATTSAPAVPTKEAGFMDSVVSVVSVRLGVDPPSDAAPMLTVTDPGATTRVWAVEASDAALM